MFRFVYNLMASTALAFCLVQFSDVSNAEARGRVCFYEHINFEGASFCLNGGDTLDNLAAMPGAGGFWNDRISSIYIEGRNSVKVCSDAYFSGYCMNVSNTLPDIRTVHANWNDLISSIQVEGFNDFPPNDRLPPGSYQRSCRRCAVDRGDLSCACKTMRGSWNYTNLNLRMCRRSNDIANIDGNLTCGR